MRKKLSPSAISQFLKSPRAYYWRYVAKLETLQPSVVTFDHDKLFGTLWAEFVDRFYQGQDEEGVTKDILAKWHEQTDGWVPPKAKDRLTKAMESLIPTYYQMFAPDDGCRHQSELWLEDEYLLGRLDGLSADGIVHEVKSTSRSPNLSDQTWKVQNSIQVKLYCVLAKASGHCIEFAFKDSPASIYRAPVASVSQADLDGWRQELHTLAEKIHSLGEDIHNYPCHPDGCCLTTKYMTSMCPFQILCEQGINDVTNIFFQHRKEH